MPLPKALLGEGDQLGWVTASQHEFIQTGLLVCDTPGEKIGASPRVAPRPQRPTVTLWLPPSSTSSVSLESRRPTSHFLSGTSRSCAVCMKQLAKSSTSNKLRGGACSDQLQTRATIASRRLGNGNNSRAHAQHSTNGWLAQRLLLLANLSAWAVILCPTGDEARVFIRFGRRYTICDECCILIISWRIQMRSAMKRCCFAKSDVAPQKTELLRRWMSSILTLRGVQ